MALSADGKTLYVADTENHAVRVIDLEKKTVDTIAGTGKQTYERNPDGPGKETALSSPWDLVLIGDTLYIAMAGTHQIWTHDLKNDVVRLHSGTGRESAIDGAHGAATFSQPSGLATDGKLIYEADSESSTIRVLDADPKGGVGSVAGSNDLFGFGLVDAVGPAARFQHPLGVALDGAGRLFVADSFNNVIRVIDVKTKKVDSFIGTGKPDEGTPEAIGFYEPGGLSIAGGTLYVADTNHHRIVAVDLATKKARVLKVEVGKPK
jgi:YVTN family beta-propeller protein